MRKTSDALRAEVLANFPDNTTGLITPAAVRQMFEDIIDSFTQAWGILQGSPGVATALTTTPTKLSIFDTVFATSPELAADATTDSITATLGGYFSFNVTVSMAGDNNADIELALYRDGAPTIWVSLTTTTGAANRAELTLEGFTQGNPGSVFELYARTLTGTANVTFSLNQFLMSTVQTNA